MDIEQANTNNEPECSDVTRCDLTMVQNSEPSQPPSDSAISVSDLWLGYNDGGNVLKGVEMEVHPATIYGLLGPSGCGKTSLIKCLVGYFKPARGSIIIYGYPSGHEHLQIPGINVGYMPQECQLYNELTIEETLKYFARLFLMQPKAIEKSIQHFIRLLDLPPGDRLVSTLSGGQKRRVSFAAALIHKPKLVILDEPTAGVDPIVTESIWAHLRHLSADLGIAVVVTTHYIEEARKADRVGLMRKGVILEEDNPSEIMRRFGTKTLEEAFLQICNKRCSLKRLSALASPPSSSSVPLSVSQSSSVSEEVERKPEASVRAKKKRSETIYKPKVGMSPLDLNKMFTINLSHWYSIVAIIFWKNTLRNLRNLPFMALQFIVPILPIVLVCLAVGLDPFDVRVAIVNDDHQSKYSQVFLKHIDSYHINAVPYPSLDSALDDIRRLNTWGALHIKANFSKSITKRIDFTDDLDNQTVKNSEIKLYADLTDDLTRIHVKRSLEHSFHNFVLDVLSKIGLKPTIANLPIRMEEPIFGKETVHRHDNFRRFSIPGCMVLVCFTMGYTITAVIITLERNDNMLDRHYVIGVSPLQFLTAHAFNRQISNVIQITIILVTCVYILGILHMPSFCQLITSFFFLFIVSICGMSLGMVIAAFSSKIDLIFILSIAVMFTLMIFSGILWPLESMRPWLRAISRLSPVTQGAHGLRNILLRDLSPWSPTVYPALVICSCWSIMFFAIGIRQFKFTS